MKQIKNIQYNKIKDLYIRLIRNRNEDPNIKDVDLLARKILYSSDRLPMCGKYRIKSHEPVNVNNLNVELGLVKADIETVHSFINEAEKFIHTSNFAANIWELYSKNRIKSALYNMAAMTSSSYIKGFTRIIDPISSMNKELSTLVIDSNGYISLPTVEGSPSRYIYERKDIIIRPIHQEFKVDVYGSVTSILNITEPGDLILSMTGQKIKESGFIMDINTISDKVNVLSLTTENGNEGIKYTVYITNDSSSRSKIYESVSTSNRIDISFPEQNIRRVEISMTLSSPNIVLHNEVKYEFKLKNISLAYDKRKSSGTYQSNEIVISESAKYISLVTEEEISGNAAIKYYVSTSKDSAGNPTGFKYFDISKSTPIDMNISKAEYNISIDGKYDIWALPPLYEYGHRLFNILEVLDDEGTSSYTINNGVLLPLGNNTIDKSSIKLYRGTGDYLITTTSSTEEKNVGFITVLPDINQETEWVNRISIPILLTEDVIPSSNSITVPYNVISADSVKVIRSDNTVVKAIISNIVKPENLEYTTITFASQTEAEVFDSKFSYSIIFAITLSEYASKKSMVPNIEDTDMIVAIDGEEYTCGYDYIIHNSTLEIELLKSGAYSSEYNVDESEDTPVNECTPVSISYTYTAVGSKSIKCFETNIFCNTETEVTVIPFSQSETASGNFHIINGSNTGTLTSITLIPGWNSIKTTHPHPSRSGSVYDLNSITMEPSDAGIILPENCIIRPYKNSMRQVSPAALMSMNPEDALKCFAYAEGKILVSFQPTFIDPNFVDDPMFAGTTGDTFINKKPNISSIDFSNAGYTSYPETFDLEFSYISTDSKSLFIRIDAEAKDEVTSVKITRLGINEYKEE